MHHSRIVVTLFLASTCLSAQAGTLRLSVGGDVNELEATYCGTDSRQSGQLVIAAEVTAVGRFRERPAVVFLSKASASGGAETDEFDLYLIDLSPELRTMPPLEAKNKILMEWPPHVRSFGVITVEGSTIRFESEDTRVIDGESEAAFADLGRTLSATVDCEQ